MFRDPRYLAPLGVLLGVIFVSAVLASENTGPSPAAPPVAFASEPTPMQTATPDGAAVDARRFQDLVKVRDAFLAYRLQKGKFPATANGAITTICVNNSDAGCVLASSKARVPFADGDQPYWFSSDGSRVVLAAAAYAASDAGGCPAGFSDALTSDHVICLEFQRPVR